MSVAAGVGAALWLARERLQAVLLGREPEAPSLKPQPSAGATIPLTAVKGIGPSYAARLAEAGIADLEGLADAKPARVAEVMGASHQRAEALIAEARRLLPG